MVTLGNLPRGSGAPMGGISGVEPPPLLKPNFFFKVKCPNCASAVRAVISKQLRQNSPHVILKPNRLVGVVVSTAMAEAFLK